MIIGHSNPYFFAHFTKETERKFYSNIRNLDEIPLIRNGNDIDDCNVIVCMTDSCGWNQKYDMRSATV
jgi:hypothetical protein